MSGHCSALQELSQSVPSGDSIQCSAVTISKQHYLKSPNDGEIYICHFIRICLAVVSSGINLSGSQSLDGSQIGGSVRGSLNRGNFNRGSHTSNVSGSFGKPSTSTLASLAGNGKWQYEYDGLFSSTCDTTL